MIKELQLNCSDCKEKFTAQGQLFFKETFQVKDFSEIALVCPACIKKWQDHWSVAQAEFFEEYASLYVNITLKSGEKYEKMDCTAMDDIVVTGIDIPLAAQKELYHIYKKWYDEKMKDCLKLCEFNEEFMRTAFTCETYGGERYENIAFRFSRLGVLETEQPIPENIKKQVIKKWNVYEIMNMPLPELNENQ